MRSLFFIFPILFLISCNPKPQTAGSVNEALQKPKNIILMIGDGMGVSQITAGLYSNNNKLNLEEFEVVGLHKSYSGDTLITDSAAGATAFSCGIKTYNGAIGVGMDTMPVKTILEIAETKGLATGMVATSTIVHATPASFIAHQPSRKMYQAIAADFMKTEIDFFIGGGKKSFDRRKDERELSKELEAKGYLVQDYFSKDFEQIAMPPSTGPNYAYFTADGDPLTVAQGRDYLPRACEMATDFLENRSDKGFFLMIESSQIDWGGHANKSDYIITEMIDFDNAIGKVMEFAKENGETLVIVTADHETGGYSINGGNQDSLVTGFTTGYHTADLIPVFAHGPGAQAFGGMYENTAIYDKMMEAFGFEEE